MNLSIRPLPKKTIGECGMCHTQQELSLWDSDLARRICQDCRPFLEAAENALAAASCAHPDDALIFRNP